MELRVHGGPALFFPSFRKTLCWEQFPGTANQLPLPGSIAFGSDLALTCRDRMRERVGEVPGAAVRGLSPSCAGKSGWALPNNYECTAACEHQWGACGSWGSTRGGEEWVVHRAGFWGAGKDAESPTSKAGKCSVSWQVCAGGLRFMEGSGAYAWESTVGHLGPQNEELQLWETSNPVVQPGLYSQRQCGCAQTVLQGEVTVGCAQPALRVGGDSGVLTACTPRRGGTEVCAVSVAGGGGGTCTGCAAGVGDAGGCSLCLLWEEVAQGGLQPLSQEDVAARYVQPVLQREEAWGGTQLVPQGKVAQGCAQAVLRGAAAVGCAQPVRGRR